MFGRKREEISILRAELRSCRLSLDLRCQGERNAIEELKEVKRELEICKNKLTYTKNSTIAERWNNLKKGNIKKHKEKGLVAYNTEWLKKNINMEYDLIAGVNYKKLWDKLYNFMNDHALAIGPDELTDPARRLEMQAQYELLLDLLNMMSDMTNEE